MTDALERLHAGLFPDPDGGAPLGAPSGEIEIAPSLDGREADLVEQLDLGRRLAVVSDVTTRQVLGRRVERALDKVATIEPVVLPRRPHADDASAARLRAATRDADALIAVGSGTINDLAKHVAAEAGRPYAVFATAPSMNGYTSVSAAITVGGLKRSLPARAPRGAFFDLEVLAAAPRRLILAGLGDSLCRATAQADWLLAHLLLGRPYGKAPFALLMEDEEPLFSAPEALVAGDLDGIGRLVRTLVLSGLGTRLAGSSAPASQGEHLISHYVDMMRGSDLPPTFHGEQIGVTTLIMARLQSRMLDGPPPHLRPTTLDRDALARHFGAALGGECWNEFAAKRLDRSRADELTARLAAGWDHVRASIGAIHRPANQLEEVLRRAGAPVAAADLGWPGALLRDAVLHAREIRDRYTFLDLTADAGQLESFVESL